MAMGRAAQPYARRWVWGTDGDDGPHAGLRLISSERKLVLRCYPKDDAQFEADVQRVIAELRGLAWGWRTLPEQVMNRVRQRYPAVTIQPRDRLAASDAPDELWYCYRDGGFLGVPTT
jgi:hypothetical protein